MIETVYGPVEAMLAFVGDRLPHVEFTDEARAIGAARDGELVAVAAYDLFNDWGCELTFAADRKWVSDGFIRAVFAYPFTQLGLERITCHVQAANRPARALLRAIGFVPEGRLRRRDPADDVLIFGMLRQECRWIAPAMLAATMKGQSDG